MIEYTLPQVGQVVKIIGISYRGENNKGVVVGYTFDPKSSIHKELGDNVVVRFENNYCISFNPRDIQISSFEE